MLRVNWQPKTHITDEPALIFGFDDAATLFEGGLTTSWVSTPSGMENDNNLVITGVGEPRQIKPLEVHRKGNLEDGTARGVYPIINDYDLPFRAGLTIHAARGTWSSLPHEFEREEILTPRPRPFYEKFAYVTLEPGGWGCQYRIGHLYRTLFGNGYDEPDDDYSREWVNDVITIRDRDILDIPLGSHPVSGGPGVHLAYWWIYWSVPGGLSLREKF